MIESPDASEEAVLVSFLQLLEIDIKHHPERLREMPQGLYERLAAVSEGVEVHLDEQIEGAVAL